MRTGSTSTCGNKLQAKCHWPIQILPLLAFSLLTVLCWHMLYCILQYIHLAVYFHWYENQEYPSVTNEHPEFHHNPIHQNCACAIQWLRGQHQQVHWHMVTWPVGTFKYLFFRYSEAPPCDPLRRVLIIPWVNILRVYITIKKPTLFGYHSKTSKQYYGSIW